MKQFKIASLGQGNKVAYNSANERFFIPVRFRDSIKIGDYMLVVNKHYDKATQLDADGNPVLDATTGQPVLIDAPFDRDEISVIGDLRTVTLAANEDRVNAGLAESIVNQEVAKLKKEYAVEDVMAAIGAH